MNALPTTACCATACDEQVSVVVPGPQGPAGPSGTNGTNGTNGGNAFCTLAAPFTQPAAAANGTATVTDNSWIVVGQMIFLQFLGNLQVFSKSGSTSVVLTNVNFPSSAAPGTVANAGALMCPSGERGATGAAGSSGSVGATGPSGPSGSAGANATTTLAANFSMPNVGANVSTQ